MHNLLLVICHRVSESFLLYHLLWTRYKGSLLVRLLVVLRTHERRVELVVPNRRDSMRAVDHASRYRCLLVEEGLLLLELGLLRHLLKVHKSVERIGMRLSLHHVEGLLVLVTLAV